MFLEPGLRGQIHLQDICKTSFPRAQRFKNYPLVNVYIAIENGTFIVDLPIKNCDFP